MGKKQLMETLWDWLIHSSHWMKLGIAIGLTLLVGSLVIEAESSEREGDTQMQMSSSAFEHNGSMPSKYTCEGENISPPLAWKEVPDTAKSLVLIVDDPDVPDPAKPVRTWVHWLLYNIPVTAVSLPENVTVPELPKGTLTGTTDRGKQTYSGPCPPIGRHRYFFKLYALDTVLPDLKQPNKADLLKAMEGHIVAGSELIGTYQKQK